MIFILAFAVTILLLIPFLKKQLKEEIRASQDQFLELTREKFESAQNRATTELETRKQVVESTVQGLKEQLDKYQYLMKQFEEDRTRKYGNLENELKNASQATTQLQETTNRLNNILGNVKLRGQWGERIVEDIIQKCGLIEDINYRKQKKLGSSAGRPDYTFILPNEHKVNMDVKFALDNYTNMVNAESSEEKERYKKEFLRNVEDRIKEIKGRGYINPEDSTLDFVLLFIPNEQVFGFIQESLPDLMDKSLEQKVVLCSPFTLYAMLSVIRQAYENFRYEKDMKEIIRLIEQFSAIYERFKGRFDDIGDFIKKLDDKYMDVKTKSFKQMDTKIRHIDDYKKGNKVIAVDTEEGALELSKNLIIDSDAVH